MTLKGEEEVLACVRCEDAIELLNEAVSGAEEPGALVYAISENRNVVGVKPDATPLRCRFPRLHDDLVEKTKDNFGVYRNI